MAYRHFEFIERHAGLLGILTAIMVSLGGLAEITPLFMEAHEVKPPPGVEPYSALRLAGFNTYVKNGCYLCHSQMIRSLRFETERYGPFSTAAESAYDRPFQWGSKRTGPDLARVGGKYSDAWQRQHLMNPRSVVPGSNMPQFNWLADKKVDIKQIQKSMRVLKMLGEPYTDKQIADAPKQLEGKTKMDALIAYLQGLGVDNEPRPVKTAATSATAQAAP
ncbi:MAG TPA: cytochrome-c oxidase, cbb3-type subunit II [Rhodanobacteraceae bacterium]